MKIRLVLSVFITFFSGWISYQTVTPFFTNKLEKVLFNWVPLPDIAAWSVFVLGLFASSIFISAFLDKKEVKGLTRVLYISVIIGMAIGTSINYARYCFIIKPNGLLECPLKIGYKKNLMRDYVTDLSLCEKL
ncbi:MULTISPECIES: hypothetical protein [Vibrio]|uniref:Uncharacterized protein n=1 Tax=Vibrio qingdaonensis TaxID=2829491 RepID=A0A9X3HYS5_9VIBR|nr:hypothetical protein [Vibrio qingdaonensis]MCW8348861.1 hypothetical protein [Vibrio qingdaonensis]